MAGGAGPWVAFVACSVVWSSTFLVIRIGTETAPPFWAGTLRLIIAAAALAAIALATRARFPRGRALAAAAVYGALQFGLNFGLLYWGERVVPSGTAAILFATIPLTTAVLASSIGLEAWNLRRVGAMLVALAGVALVFGGELSAATPLLPLAAVFVAAVSAAVSGIVLKLAPPQSPFAVNAVGAVVGIAILAPVSFLAGEPHALPASWAAWWPILYLAFAGNLAAFVLFAWLLNRWPASRVSLIGLVTPVVAVALGAVAAGERLPPLALAGAALVLAGVAAAIALRDRAPAAARAAQPGAAVENVSLSPGK